MPNSVLGNSTEASIDQVNIWMRSTPWYQAQMRSWGQDPGHPTLTSSQSEQIKRLAQANGVVVDEGNVELDDHGNFNPIGHKLRNTLIVAGVAAATIATMGAAGAFAGGAAGAGASATGATGISAVGAGSAAAGAGGAAGAAGAVGAGLTYADLLKYGLPVAGNLVNGVIQAKASTSASEAQQRYLEEALAYQKEQDAYARTTDASRYADSRGDLAAALAKEENRYAGYQGRIAPFIANGVSSNDRMSALLGLPARPASTSMSTSGGNGSRPMDDTRSVDVGNAPSMFYAAMHEAGLNPVAVQGHGQQIVDAINKKYPGLGATVDPTTDAVVWPGIGPLDVTVDSGKGGWSFRPSGNGSSVAPAKPYTPPTSAAAAPASPSPLAPAAASSVQMRGPDGSVRAVNAGDVKHYQTLGATVIGAAA